MSSIDDSFRDFLTLAGVSAAEYAALPAIQRVEIMAHFRACPTSHGGVPSPSVPLPARPSPRTSRGLPSPSAWTHGDEEACEAKQLAKPPLPVRDDGESYEFLVEQPFITELHKVVAGPRLSRLRFDFPKRELHSKFAERLSAEQRMWLSRAYFHADEKQQPAGSSMTVDELFELVLVPKVLRAYDDFCHAAHANSNAASTVTAQTYRKGLYCLSAAVTTLGGANLTALAEATRPKASEALATLADLARAWRDAASLDLNVAETKHLLHNQATAPPKDILMRLYLLFLVERFWFQSNFGGRLEGSMSKAILERGVGFAFLALLLSRPVTRPEAINALKTSHFENKLASGAPTTLYVQEHKTARSFKTLVMDLPGWGCSILSMYARKLRPALLRAGWGKASRDSFFPQEASQFMKQLLKEHSIGTMTCSAVRRLVCQHIGLITPEDTSWGCHRVDLQSTAAHIAVRGTVLETHYEQSAKPAREALLQRFLRHEFFVPAEICLEALLRGHAPTLPHPAPHVGCKSKLPPPPLRAASSSADASEGDESVYEDLTLEASEEDEQEDPDYEEQSGPAEGPAGLEEEVEGDFADYAADETAACDPSPSLHEAPADDQEDYDVVELRARLALLEAQLDAANKATACATPSRKRPQRVAATPTASTAKKQAVELHSPLWCSNKRNSKRCLAGATVTFEQKQPCCDECVSGYGSSGHWTVKRFQDYALRLAQQLAADNAQAAAASSPHGQPAPVQEQEADDVELD